jgi:hypothetical protein
LELKVQLGVFRLKFGEVEAKFGELGLKFGEQEAKFGELADVGRSLISAACSTVDLLRLMDVRSI